MVHSTQAPPFDGYVNEFFEVEKVIDYYRQNNLMKFYETLRSIHRIEFMAYKQQYLENNYYYIRSGKMICFHVTIAILSILGLIVSINTFPGAYGRA